MLGDLYERIDIQNNNSGQLFINSKFPIYDLK